MRASSLLALLCASGALSLRLVAPPPRSCGRRAPAPRMGWLDNFLPAASDDEKERAYQEQQEVLARRRNPAASAKYFADMAARRQKSEQEFDEKFAWQSNPNEDPLVEWKRRQEAGKLNPLGYEDEPEGGIPMPMASFGVGGEFGTGGKYDNGERFDLRLPYAEQGWVDEGEKDYESVDFFANLMSGGRLQREADERRRKAAEE